MKEVLKLPKQKIGDVEVDVKKATPKIGNPRGGEIQLYSCYVAQATAVEATEQEEEQTKTVPSSTSQWVVGIRAPCSGSPSAGPVPPSPHCGQRGSQAGA